jgi:uncharacterized protein YkwD
MPYVDSLEPRRLLAAAFPSALEQYVLELVNRARASPTAEAARYSVDLNEGLAAGTISTAAKQPLAINPFLTDSARNHSQWMIDTDTFSHTGAGGSDPGDRMAAAGYTFSGNWTWGENIAWRSFSSGSATAGLLAQIHQDLFVDSGIVGRGHRKNILNGAFREVGPGFVSGNFQSWNAGMLTQDFAASGTSVFLTGVAYNDAVTDDNFYTPGEGLAGVTISAKRLSDNQAFSTTTWTSGGYSLPLAPGTYDVTASGGAFATPVTFSAVTISSANVKRDFVPGGGGTSTDIIRPTGSLVSHPTQKVAGAKYYQFTVTYTDNVALNAATFDNYDTLITDPWGVRRYGALAKVSAAGNGTPRTVTYLMKAPGSRFDAADNGVYTISLRKKQVADTAGNLNAGKVLGQFSVLITPVASAIPAARSIQPAPRRRNTFATSLFESTGNDQFPSTDD